jgi:hypothetical protein
MDSFEIIQRTNKEKTYVVNAVDTDINRLPYIESLYGKAKDQVDKMQRTRQGLENDIADRKNKISLIEKLHSLVNKSARKQNKE